MPSGIRWKMSKSNKLPTCLDDFCLVRTGYYLVRTTFILSYSSDRRRLFKKPSSQQPFFYFFYFIELLTCPDDVINRSGQDINDQFVRTWSKWTEKWRLSVSSFMVIFCVIGYFREAIVFKLMTVNLHFSVQHVMKIIFHSYKLRQTERESQATELWQIYAYLQQVTEGL